MWDQFILGQPEWRWWVIAIAILLIAMLIFVYRRVPLPFGIKLAAIGLKSLAIGLALFCLLEPLAARQRPKPLANWVAILVDNSQSMQALIGNSEASSERDQESLSRWKLAMSSQSSWQQRLAEDYRIRRYRFGNRLESVDDIADIQADESQSSLVRSLRLLSERFRDRPLASVILVSDGQATDLGTEDVAWEEFDFPIYPVRWPDARAAADVRVSSVAMRQSDFEAAPVTIVANIQSQGFAGKSALVELIDDRAKIVQTESIKLEGDDASQLVEFRFRPEESGVQGFRVRASLPTSDPESDDGKSKSGRIVELTKLNNQSSVVVDRGHGPYRILYVAGRPNWEHKFLRRALQEDDEIQLASLVRIAKKEPKFSFRDSKVDSSNPLFSGFEDVSDEEKEQYNEAVFARLGVSDATQLQGGFPKTAEELFAYQAIILDDLETDFLNVDQQTLIRKFVSFRGGGLLFLGGLESMRGKGFRESVLAQLMPIYGEERSSMAEGMASAKPAPVFRFDLTREGWLQPFLRTSDTEAGQKKALKSMPALQVLNQSGGVKPGAAVFATATIDSDSSDSESTQPALVTQRFGKGRTAALLVGDMWRWALHHNQATQSPLFQAWRQMVRWLIADVPRAISMRVEPAVESFGGQTATVLVEVLSTEFQSMDNVQVELDITLPDGSLLNGKAEPSKQQSGLYEMPLVTNDEGVYKAVATVFDADGSIRGTSQVGWVHEPSVTELQSLGVNASLLEEIARRSGGSVVEWTDLDRFSFQLAEQPAPITETKIEPLWHRSWVLITILGCLCGEWWLRRRNGLR